MKAIVQRSYGLAPDVLKVEEIPLPVIGEDQVLVRVVAAGVNPADSHFVTGKPYLVRMVAGLRRPKAKVPGTDVAGRVEAVGREVTELQVGDEVYGGIGGGYAEFASAKEGRLAHKPGNLSFEQAASVPIAAITALQALRDKGRVQPDQNVLINGASGGVGTFAVQIAKTMGAEVTGVCSTRNVDMVRSIGADHVIDYTSESFTKGAKRYDVIIDNVGGHPLAAFRRILTPNGIYVSVGADMGDWVAPLVHLIKIQIASAFRNRTMRSMLAKQTREDMAVVGGLLESRQVVPVIDRTYPLDDAARALEYQMEGHARGKIVVTML